MTNFDAERHTAKEFAEMQQVFDEEDFLKMVRQCKSIGYGRMMQIVSFEWHEHDNIGALTLGTTIGMQQRTTGTTTFFPSPKLGRWNRQQSICRMLQGLGSRGKPHPLVGAVVDASLLLYSPLSH